MIPIAVYPPAPLSLSGDNLTASRFLEQPQFIARALRDFGALRYVGNLLLPQRVNAVGGSVAYEVVGENLFSDGILEAVAPGSEYTLTTVGDGTAAVAKVGKWGKDTLITDEAVANRNMDPVTKGLLKLVNSARLAIDGTVISAISTAITATAAAAAKWDGSGTTPNVLRDILKAKAAVRAQNLGYEPDTLLVDDAVWALLASDATIQAAMARENTSNPIYTGRFSVLAGLEVVPTSTANMPGGVGTAAFVFDRNNLGFIATQNIGGGYQSAGDLVESKRMRDDDADATRVRARSIFAAVVTDPLAGYKITAVV